MLNFPLTFQCTSIIEWDTFLKDLAFSSTVQRTAEGYRHLELDAILDAIEAVRDDTGANMCSPAGAPDNRQYQVHQP